MKNIYLLGATGSIGTQTLQVLRSLDESYRLVSMCFGSKLEEAIKIIDEFHPKLVCTNNESNYNFLKNKYNNIDILYGDDNLINVATCKYYDDGEDIVISLDKFNRIIKLINNNLVNVPDLFLMFNKVLEDISLKKAKLLGSFFLSYNSSLLEIELPKVKKIGEKFMAHSNLESVFLPQVTVIGNGFLAFNYAITNVSLPEAITIGNDFIRFNSRIKSVNLPKLKKLGCNALNSISLFAKFYAPCLCDWRFGNERIRMLAYKGQAIVNDSRKKYVLKIK